MYCALCKRPVEARRQIGAGTIILAVATGGLWLFAIPFYEKRCAICRTAAVSLAAPPGEAGAAGGRITELERRLSVTETELENVSRQLDHVTTERDFYRQLLDDPTRRSERLPATDPARKPDVPER